MTRFDIPDILQGTRVTCVDCGYQTTTEEAREREVRRGQCPECGGDLDPERKRPDPHPFDRLRRRA